MKEFHTIPLTQLTGAICALTDVPAPEKSQGVMQELVDAVFEKTDGRKVDRVLMYNPDAIGRWTCENTAISLRRYVYTRR